MPYYLLLFSFILEYVRLSRFYPFIDSAKINVIVPLLAFVLALGVNSRIDHSAIWKHSNTKWLMYLLFLMVVSMIAIGGENNTYIFRGVLGYCFLYYAITRLADTIDKLKGVFLMLGICHIILIAITPDIVLDPATRTYLEGAPFLGDGNDFGLSLVIVFPLMLYLYMDSKKKYARLFYLTLTLFFVLSVIGTQSRGASLGLGAILVFLWSKSQKKILGFFAIGVLSFTVVLFAAPQYFQRMATLSHPEEEGSAKGRIDAWTTGIGFAVSSPVIGIGVGNYGRLNHNKTAHSMYFLALGEMGFPGAIFILGYVISNYRKLNSRIKGFKKEEKKCKEEYKKRKELERIHGIQEKEHNHEIQENGGFQSHEKLFTYLCCSMVGLAVSGAFLSCLYYPHIYVLGGMIVAANQIYELDKVKLREKNGAFEQTPGNQPQREGFPL